LLRFWQSWSVSPETPGLGAAAQEFQHRHERVNRLKWLHKSPWTANGHLYLAV